MAQAGGLGVAIGGHGLVSCTGSAWPRQVARELVLQGTGWSCVLDAMPAKACH